MRAKAFARCRPPPGLAEEGQFQSRESWPMASAQRACCTCLKCPCGFVGGEKLLASHSHSAFTCSPWRGWHFGPALCPRQKRKQRGNIYEFYHELAGLGDGTHEWCKFALFLLITATGSAISECGFSAMSAVHGKSKWAPGEGPCGQGLTGPKRTQKDPKGPVLDWGRNGLVEPIKKRQAVGGCKADSILNPHDLRPFLRHFWPMKRLRASSDTQKKSFFPAPNAGRTHVD
jgi:hypothetical protein